MKITILYDNVKHMERLKTGWGFSALVEHENEKILFDTGPKGPSLVSNLRLMRINIKDINSCFISHSHPDHTGGLKCFLKENPGANIYPPSLPLKK